MRRSRLTFEECLARRLLNGRCFPVGGISRFDEEIELNVWKLGISAAMREETSAEEQMDRDSLLETWDLL